MGEMVVRQDAPPAPVPRWWNASVIALAFGALLYAFSATAADPDLWGHLKFGDDLWRTGRIVRADIYSYTAVGQPWINHEWLAEAILACVFRVGGSPGLVLLKTGIALLIAVLLYRHLRQGGLGPLAAAFLLVAGCVPIAPGVITIRPQAFTYLALLVLMLLLVRADRGRPAVLWWAPLVFAAWANLHGGFLAGVAIFTLWTAVRFLATLVGARRLAAAIRAERTILLAWAASLVATLVTPYGVGLWRFLLRTAIEPRPEIVEWNPIEAFSLLGAVYLVLLAVGIAGLVGSRRPRSLAALAVFGCVALAPLTAVRHTPLVGLALVVLAGEHIASASSAWMARWPSAGRETGWRLRPWVASLFAIQAAGLIVLSVPHARCIEVSTTDYPIAAVGILRASEVRGNLAIFFDWGEYAIWHLGPGVRVSMDGRRETLYPDAVYWDDHRFTFGIGDWQAALGRGPADLALVSPRFSALNLMKLEPGWRLVYEDPASGLFVRRGSPLAEQLAVAPRPPRPDRACFP